MSCQLRFVITSYSIHYTKLYDNAANAWDKEVAIVRKQQDLPIEFTINDHEQSREPNAQPVLWMTDDRNNFV